MAEKNKPTGLPPRVPETGSHGFERVVIKWFNPAKGIGFFSGNGGPDTAFALEKAARPTLSQLIGALETGEAVLVRFSPDRKHVTEIRRLPAKDRAEDADLYARIASGKVPFTLDESSKQLALEALKKASARRNEAFQEPLPARAPELKDQVRLDDPLQQYLKDKNIPPALWSDTAAAIERLVGKKLAAAVARPLWDDRAQYPALANLSAPEFLKRVWADQIGADGTIEKELVRQNDRSLMGKVDNYISTRHRRGQDAGDAKGLRFIARKTRPKAKPRR